MSDTSNVGAPSQGDAWSTGTSAAIPPPAIAVDVPLAGQRLQRFLDELASDAPTPGGGAWAGVVAAAGAARGILAKGIIASVSPTARVVPRIEIIRVLAGAIEIQRYSLPLDGGKRSDDDKDRKEPKPFTTLSFHFVFLTLSPASQ